MSMGECTKRACPSQGPSGWLAASCAGVLELQRAPPPTSRCRRATALLLRLLQQRLRRRRREDRLARGARHSSGELLGLQGAVIDRGAQHCQRGREGRGRSRHREVAAAVGPRPGGGVGPRYPPQGLLPRRWCRSTSPRAPPPRGLSCLSRALRTAGTNCKSQVCRPTPASAFEGTMEPSRVQRVHFDSNMYEDGQPYLHSRVAERAGSDDAWQLGPWRPSRLVLWSDNAGARRVTLAVVVSATTRADGAHVHSQAKPSTRPLAVCAGRRSDTHCPPHRPPLRARGHHPRSCPR